jgi:hypothetical protein
VTVTDERLAEIQLRDEAVTLFEDGDWISRGDSAVEVVQLVKDRRALLQHIAALQRDHAASAAQRDARVAELERHVTNVADWLDSPRMGTMQYMEGTGFYEDKSAFLDELRAALAQPDAARAEGEQS